MPSPAKAGLKGANRQDCRRHATHHSPLYQDEAVTPTSLKDIFTPIWSGPRFRFAPRIRDLADRRLYVADDRAVYTALNPMVGGTLDFRGISENWNETLRGAASIKAGNRCAIGVDASARGLSQTECAGENAPGNRTARTHSLHSGLDQ
jgi:Tn3 transposase DDE domain